MSKALTARELFGVQEFNPLDIDLSEIKELSSAIPTSGEIDLNQAEILAAKFLRGADLCTDLLSIATVYATKCETAKKKAYSDAAMNKATASGIKTDKSRLLFADGDADYIEACNRCGEAQALVKWLSSKSDSLIRSHYMLKQMLTRNYAGEKAAGFNVNTDKMIEDANGTEEEDNDGFGKDW